MGKTAKIFNRSEKDKLLLLLSSKITFIVVGESALILGSLEFIYLFTVVISSGGI